MTRFALLLAILGACTKDNPYYMAGDAGGSGSADSSMRCTVDSCTNGTLCNMSTGACVACLADNTGCSATSNAPICDTGANACRACVTHSDCPSEACLPSGACGTDAEVAYVSNQGDDTQACTHAAPCKTISLASTKSKAYVKLQTNIDETVIVNGGTFTVLADPGTTITRSLTTGPVMTFQNTAHVTIEDATIQGGAGTSGHGIQVVSGQSNVEVTLRRVKVIDNAGIGLAIGDGKLTVSRTLVSKNTLGGLSAAGTFDVSNSIFAANGSTTNTSAFGGVKLDPIDNTSKFEFNTVADNLAQSASASFASRGINCVNAFTIKNTLVTGNPTAANCSFSYSMFDTGTWAAPNKVGVPHYKSTDTAQVLDKSYYRLDSSSDAVDSADPAATLATDIDGDARPKGLKSDIGADESQ